MQSLLHITLALLLSSSSLLAMTKTDYSTMASLSLQNRIEDIPESNEYLYKLKQRLEIAPLDKTELSLTTEDFEIYEKTLKEKDLFRLKKHQKILFKKLSDYIKRSKKLTSSQILNSWMNFNLTKNEKESLRYLIDLRYKKASKETPKLETDLIQLMQSFNAVSISNYQKNGFTFAESLYARHMALYKEMLSLMENNFDPMIYFHIESCMKAEEKFLIQAYYDEQLNIFSRSAIATKNSREDSLQHLLKSYFEKRKLYTTGEEFFYSS